MNRISNSDKMGFSLSVVLHLLVAVGLWNGFGNPSPIPLGVERKGDPTFIEIGLNHQGSGFNSQPVHIRKKNPSQDKEAILTKSQPKAATTPDKLVAEPFPEKIAGEAGPGRFGLRDGTATQGPMGAIHGRQVSARDRYLYELKILLEGRKIYPRMARQRGESGKVIVRFQVRSDGHIGDVEVASPSQYHRLNQAALELVKGVKRYKPFSESIGTQALTLEVPIEYVLN